MMRQAHDKGYFFGFKNDILMNHKKSRAEETYRDNFGNPGESVNKEAVHDPLQPEQASRLQWSKSSYNIN